MTTDYIARRAELTKGFSALAEDQPAVMRGFGKLHRGATTSGALDQKTKELIALATAITGHCEGCIAFHTHDAIKAGASREEIAEAVGVAVLMGGGPAAVYGSDAMTAADQFLAAER